MLPWIIPPRVQPWSGWKVDFFTVSKCLPLGLCKGTVSGLCKMVEIPTSHVSLQCNAIRHNPYLCSDRPITKRWCLAIKGHVSYPCDSPDAASLGLCSSLGGKGRSCSIVSGGFNTLRLGLNGLYFQINFLCENYCILINISLKFVSKGPINNKPSVAQIRAWCQKATGYYLNHWWRSILTNI